MKKDRRNYIDVEIDKLTNLITNTVTGEIFDTNVKQLGINDIK